MLNTPGGIIKTEHEKLYYFMNYLQSDNCLMDTFIDAQPNFVDACNLGIQVAEAIAKFIGYNTEALINESPN